MAIAAGMLAAEWITGCTKPADAIAHDCTGSTATRGAGYYGLYFQSPAIPDAALFRGILVNEFFRPTGTPSVPKRDWFRVCVADLVTDTSEGCDGLGRTGDVCDAVEITAEVIETGPFTAVPEPKATGLVAGGLASMAKMRRRRGSDDCGCAP